MKKYTTLMSAYGIGVGIDFNFHGTVANTLSAHRLIQHFQEELGPETADKIVDSLFKQYFEQEAHPAGPTTLLRAALDGGVERAKAEAFVGDEYEALPETKLLIREQASNGVEYVFPEPVLLSFLRFFGGAVLSLERGFGRLCVVSENPSLLKRSNADGGIR